MEHDFTAKERAMLADMLERSNRPGFDPQLDMTVEEQRIAVKYLRFTLQQVLAYGVDVYVTPHLSG
jgi:hypothetical protein